MSTIERIQTTLSAHYYFHTVDIKEIEEIASFTHLTSFKEGESIFMEGDPSKSFFIVQEGQVQVYKMSPKGRQVILRLFNPGESFAEIPFWQGAPFYPANAVCLEDTILLMIEGKRFKQFVTNRPKVLMAMLSGFSEHLRELSDRIEDLALRNVDSKLAKYLLSYQESFLEEGRGSKDIEIQVQKKILASILGTIPETLSRSFKKLAEQGIISIEKRSVKILNPKALENRAELED